MRSLRLLSLVWLGLVPSAGCHCFLGITPCAVDDDCAAGVCNSFGVCGAPPAPPIVTTMEGDGVALGLADSAEGGATRRIRTSLVVGGTNFAGVSAARLVGDGVDVELAIADRSAQSLQLALPSLTAGAFTLQLSSAGGSTQVGLELRGGERGKTTRVEPRSTAECADGVAFVVARDDDDDGTIDVDEEGRSEVHTACPPSVFTCDGGECVSARPLRVPSLSIGAASAATRVTEARTIRVPGDAATVSAAIRSLAALRLAADVTIAVVGVVDEPLEFSIDHPDGEHIHIVGDPGAVLRFAQGGMLVTTALGLVDEIVLEGPGVVGTVGLNVTGHARIGSGTTLRGFFVGARAIDGGVIDVDGGVIAEGNSAGFEALFGGGLLLGAVHARDNGAGIRVEAGAYASAEPGCVLERNAIAVAALSGSEVHVVGCTLRDSTSAALSAQAMALLVATDATFTGNAADIVANLRSVVDAPGANPSTSTCLTGAVCLP